MADIRSCCASSPRKNGKLEAWNAGPRSSEPYIYPDRPSQTSPHQIRLVLGYCFHPVANLLSLVLSLPNS